MRETKNKLHLWQGWEKSLRQTSGGSHLMQNTVETTINNSRRKHSRVYFRINCCSETAQRLTKFYASVPSDFLRCSNNPFQLLCFKNDSWPFGDIWVKQMGLCVLSGFLVTTVWDVFLLEPLMDWSLFDYCKHLMFNKILYFLRIWVLCWFLVI